MKQTTYRDSDAPLQVLLADDDEDDRFFFSKALKALPIHTQLKMVTDGEKLMHYLLTNSKKLPDVLFLDVNMPRKSGADCLVEIRKTKAIEHLPVIIYSTSNPFGDANDLYRKGAHYYFVKGNPDEMKLMLHFVFALLLESNFIRPPRSEFVLTLKKAIQAKIQK